MRIVSLLPSATEICFALGLGPSVVGVTHECDFPPEAAALPHLTSSTLPPELAGRPGDIDRHVRANVHAGSSLYALDASLLDRLAPDLILTQELCAVCAVSYEIVATAAKQLRGDPRIISLEPSSLEDVYATIGAVADLAGVSNEGRALVARLRERAAALAARTAASNKPRVLVMEWTNPPMSGGHWTPGLVELAGGTPMLANPGGDSRRITWDAIVQADPDVIIVAPCGFGMPATLDAIGALAAEPAWTQLRAVRGGSAWAVDGNAYVNRPGPRLIDTAEIFATAIHGLATAGANGPEALRRCAVVPA